MRANLHKRQVGRRPTREVKICKNLLELHDLTRKFIKFRGQPCGYLEQGWYTGILVGSACAENSDDKDPDIKDADQKFSN